MNDRLNALRRLHTVQRQVKRLAEAKLAMSERHKHEVDSALHDLSTFLEGNPVGGLAALASQQGGRLARREAEAEKQRANRAKVLIEAQTRLTMMEHRIDDLDGEHRRVEERKDLQQLLDGFMSRPRQGD